MKRTLALWYCLAAMPLFALDPGVISTIWPQIRQADITLYGSKPQLQLWYDPSTATLIDEDDELHGAQYVLRFRSAAQGRDLYIGITSVAGRFGFVVTDRVEGHDVLLSILGNQVVIPGNDVIYVTRWNFFNPKTLAKYVIGAGGVNEVRQALYPLNARDVAQVGFTIYSDRSTSSRAVGSVREGATVTAIGFTTDSYDDFKAERWCLVSSELGLIGWTPVIFTDKWFANHQPAMLKLFDNDSP